MKTRYFLTITSAALLLGAVAIPAQALDLSVGGISISAGSGGNGGTQVSVGAAGTGISATVGGGQNIANVGVGGASVGVGTQTGNLITSNNGATNVNLGGLPVVGGLTGTVGGVVNGVTDPVGTILGGVGGPNDPGNGNGNGNGNGGGGLNPVQVASAFGGMSSADQQLLKVRCKSILMNPATFDASMIKLCRLLAQLGR